MSRSHPLVVPLIFLIALPLFGQAPHRHDSGDKPGSSPARHPTQVDTSRFFTNRGSPVVLPLPEEKDAFFFTIFGDRTGGPAEGVKVLAQAVDEVNLLEPDLVMTVGDLVQGYNQSNEWMGQMREFKGIMDRLVCPWFPVAGNHDVYWRGANKPEGEHEKNYETHFGPLWYAFEHKNSWFIALYTDEGDEAGEKTFSRPEAQRMSPAQLTWLEGILTRAKDAEHVFVFLHHPRWLGGGYGDDWERVHKRLKEAGNVSAVFAGHIHRMRYDGVRDGIEYFTLATTGGGQSGIAKEAGYLHHFHVVTVRKGRIAVAGVPVGSVMDVRAITGEVSDAARLLDEKFNPNVTGDLVLAGDFSLNSYARLRLENPTQRALEVTAIPECADGRFAFSPDHSHLVIPPGDQAEMVFRVRRGAFPIDPAFALPAFHVTADYLTDTARFAIVDKRVPIPLDPGAIGSVGARVNRALLLDGKADAIVIPAGKADFDDETLTVEGWLNARAFRARQGFVNKTEESEYGFFVNRGRPEFCVHVEGRYIIARAEKPVLKTGQWHHLAGTFDGQRVVLFVDGRPVAKAEGPKKGRRTRNALPLVIAADVDRRGEPTSHFPGLIDDIRISKGVRYGADKDFTPQRPLVADERTLLHLSMDVLLPPWAPDGSRHRRHGFLRGLPQLDDVQR